MGIFSGTKPTLLAGYIITIVAFVIHLIAFATPYWYVKTVEVQASTSKTYIGLWKSCRSQTIASISTSSCGRYFIEVNANVSISKLANTTLF